MGKDTFFDVQEWRSEKFFGYKEKLDPGVYEFIYLLRLTHKGRYHIKPAHAFSFYEPEVFGRNAGEEFLIGEAREIPAIEGETIPVTQEIIKEDIIKEDIATGTAFEYTGDMQSTISSSAQEIQKSLQTIDFVRKEIT